VNIVRIFSDDFANITRLFSSGVHSHEYYHNFCSACTVTHFHFWILQSFFFTYFTYLVSTAVVVVITKLAETIASLHCDHD